MVEKDSNWVEEIIEEHDKERQQQQEYQGKSSLPAAHPVTTQDFQDAAIHFNDFVDQEWPQEKDGELNYYPLGSLTFALYSQADTAYRLDNERLPQIERTEEIQLPDSTQKIFEEMTRPVGDFDFLKLNSEESPGKGGVIDYEEINSVPKHPEKPHPQLILKRGENELGPFFDPLQTGNPDPIQLEIDGEVHYAPSFKDTAAFKALHLLERYSADPENDRERRKNNDMEKEFPMVMEAVEPFYSREEMVEDIHEHILQDEVSTLNWRREKEKEAEREYEQALLDDTLGSGEFDEREFKMAKNNYEFEKGDMSKHYSDNLKWFGQLLIRSDASEQVKDFFWDVWEQGPYDFVEAAQERGIESDPDIPNPENYSDSKEFLEEIDRAYREYHNI